MNRSSGAEVDIAQAGFGQRGSLRQNPEAVLWLTILLSLVLSSVAFAYLIESNKYKAIVGPAFQDTSLLDRLGLLWLLTTKSMGFFVVWLPLWGMFLVLRLRRTVAVTANLIWILVFYFMAFDLCSVGFAGYHTWDYLPNIIDMWENPKLEIWQWVGDRLTSEAALVFGFFAIASPIVFFGAKWIVAVCSNHFRWILSPTFLGLITLSYVVGSLSIIFVLVSVPDRICSIMPYTPAARSGLLHLSQLVSGWTRFGDIPYFSSTLSPMRSVPASGHRNELAWQDRPNQEQHSEKSDIDKTFGKFRLTTGNDRHLNWGMFALIGDQAHAKQFPTLGPERELRRSLRQRESLSSDTPSGSRPMKDDSPSFYSPVLYQADQQAATKLLRESLDPRPADTHAFVDRPDLPNVILIIFESFRHSSLGPEFMPKLDAWAEQGLRLQRHYSGSNCSHLGLFSIFYSRAPIGYHETLNRKIPPQMLDSLRKSGYEITVLTSGEMTGFRRLEHFINGRTCDNFVMEGEFTLKSMNDWPQSDRKKLDHAQRIVNGSQGRPQFVFFYLVSSHYPYAFPPEFEILKERPNVWAFLDPKIQTHNHLSRYANALSFLEHEVLKMMDAIDLSRNIVIITGDHGESMGEDGVFTHGSRMSEIQMRVPLVMVGGGIEPRKISTATAHYDILPTLLHVLAGKSVPVENSHGRDLIGDTNLADEVTSVPANGMDWDGFLVMRGDERMVFRRTASSFYGPTVQFDGLADESGHYESKLKHTHRGSRSGR